MAPGPPRLLEAVRCQCTLPLPPSCQARFQTAPSITKPGSRLRSKLAPGVCARLCVIVQVRCAPFPPAPGSLNLNHRYFHRTCSTLSVMFVCPEPVLVNCSVSVHVRVDNKRSAN